MWAPSFVSVLHDLWCFFWRIESVGPRSDVSAVVPQTVGTNELTVINRPITLDTQRPTVVQLQVDSLYTEESIETILIRSKLKAYDQHLLQPGNLTLVEWLLYKIHIQNNTLSLLALRMSPLGLWHQTLKGASGVKIGVEPATSALMEWFNESGKGMIGMVERVSPDNTITMRTITTTPSGTYVEQIFPESVWREFGPVFTRLRA